MATNNQNFNYIRFLDDKNIRYFNYITHINNLGSILERGIYSRNKIIELNIPFYRIDYERVQSTRIRNIKKKYGFHIHDYVPLFFSTHAPMLYVICNPKNGRKFKGLDPEGKVISVSRNDIAILKIDRKILVVNGARFSNKNCACNDVELYSDVSDLPKLNWLDICRKSPPIPKYCSSPKREYILRMWKLNKAAEILVPDIVPLKFIRRVVVVNQKIKNILDRKINTIDSSKVFVDEEEFSW
ncbi:MAG TPA: DUF4433 domain-containing protein [Candidatus Atribacteria bacterium]|nr:DUF4433 domain-containing protein [Candidatus Atribacteria bacterium]